MTLPSPWTARRVALATLTILSIVGAGWLLYRFRTVWVTLLVAIVIASSIKPIMAWLTAKGVSRRTAALAIYLVGLMLAVGFVVLVLPMVLEQVPLIGATLGTLYQDARDYLAASPSSLAVRLAGYLPPTLNGASAGPPQTVADGLSALASLLRGLFLVIAVPVFAFLWTVEGEHALLALLLVLPAERRAGIREIAAAAEQKVGAFVRGQAIVCASVGAMVFPAYLMIGLRHALALALLAAVFEVLSYPGTIIAAAVAVLVALTQSPIQALWVILAVVGINLVQSYVVAPRVMRGAVGVKPFVRLLAITACGIAGGVAGVFLAIPAAAVLQLLFERRARSHPVEVDA